MVNGLKKNEKKLRFSKAVLNRNFLISNLKWRKKVDVYTFLHILKYTLILITLFKQFFHNTQTNLIPLYRNVFVAINNLIWFNFFWYLVNNLDLQIDEVSHNKYKQFYSKKGVLQCIAKIIYHYIYLYNKTRHSYICCL